MKSLACASLLSLVQIVTATPVGTPTADSTIPLVKGDVKPLSGPAQLLKTYNKYGWVMPEGIGALPVGHIMTPATTGSGVGVTYATPEPFKSQYLSQVTIGNQKLKMTFDTGRF